MADDQSTSSTKPEALVQVRELKKYFPVKRGLIFEREVGAVKAVDGISFDIRKGETLGLVGESGCGKTTAGRVILGLYPITDGSVTISGIQVDQASKQELQTLRRKAQMIFQDPYASLNPRWTVNAIIGEPLRVHKLLPNNKARMDRVNEPDGSLACLVAGVLAPTQYQEIGLRTYRNTTRQQPAKPLRLQRATYTASMAVSTSSIVKTMDPTDRHKSRPGASRYGKSSP